MIHLPEYLRLSLLKSNSYVSFVNMAL